MRQDCFSNFKITKSFIMRILSILLFSFFILSSCNSDPASNYKELDLMAYGVPITIMAPDSADIKKEDWISQQGVTVTKGKDYDLQIWASQATVSDVATLKATKLEDIKSNDLFSKIIKDDPAGFIFENKLDSTTLYYGFCHLVIQGDNEYEFRNGLRGNFTLEQAERMYDSVKSVDKK